MPPAYRRGRRPGAPRRQLRRVEIARSLRGNSALGIGVLTDDLFVDWRADTGTLNAPPGITVVGIRYRLAVGGATGAANSQRITYGFQVGSTELDAADMSPNDDLHQDWMEWGSFNSSYAANEWKQVVGAGDEGFRHVKSMRKLNAIQETLWFGIVASAAPANFGYTLAASVVFKLP
jgi:hypothetical protein